MGFVLYMNRYYFLLLTGGRTVEHQAVREWRAINLESEYLDSCVFTFNYLRSVKTNITESLCKEIVFEMMTRCPEYISVFEASFHVSAGVFLKLS